MAKHGGRSLQLVPVYSMNLKGRRAYGGRSMHSKTNLKRDQNNKFRGTEHDHLTIRTDISELNIRITQR